VRDDRRNYIVVGTFVVAMVAALFVLLAYVARWTGATDRYHIYFESVMGISPGTQVYFEGYPVGLLEGIRRERGDRDRFRVDISVDAGWRIPKDSVAEIAAPGLLAAVVLNIQAGDTDEFLAPGSEIEGKEPANMVAVVSDTADQVNQLLAEVQPVIQSVSEGVPLIVGDLRKVTEQVDRLLSPANVERIGAILGNLESTTGEADALVAGLGATKQRIDSVLVTLDSMMSEDDGELAHALDDLHHTLESVAARIDRITDNLDTTTRNMSEFSEQLRRDPSVILRGRETEEASP